ncbi:MAG: lipoprotein-releasing ABC transporter permease subunit [Rhodospirillales bacterium]|nr:lipoprotein-releasing ABC transporter permease subunit [Rhodospirillales bacterium]MCB9995607.1 lipoprotein-releasing ABC transporter permease subunit [Rhodospirillales bacterium]
MFTPFERMVAGRYLRARKAEGFVSVIAGFSFLGIMLGVATLIIVMSVMNGFRAELLTRILGLNGHINIYSHVGKLEDYKVMQLKVEGVEGVITAVPMIEGQALLSVHGSATGVIVRGLSQEDFTRKPILANSLIRGDVRDFDGTNVAIGKAMADKLKVTVGDEITLIAPKGKASPFGTIPRSRTYTIGAVFDVGMFEYNSGFIFMPLEAAQVFFQMQGKVSSLEVFTEDPVRLQHIRENIALTVGDRAGVYDWRDMNSSFFNALQVERNVMFLILTMIILVAAFNIISSMIMLVKDKGRDIAIMRTMGASRRSMMKIFILTGASIGFIGTFAGAVLGIVFALNIEAIRQWLQGLTGTDLFAAEIYFLSKLPAEIDWHEVTAVVGMAFVLSILATLYPAWRAAKLDPVEALRYES